MINLDVNVDIQLRNVHYPIYFKRKNICVACGAEKVLKFINIFGKETGSEIHPFDHIKCGKCGALYSIDWDKESDGKLYPSAIDPSIKRDFTNAFKTTFQDNGKYIKRI